MSFQYSLQFTAREIEVLHKLTREEAQRLSSLHGIECPKGCLMDVTFELDTKLTTTRNRILPSHVRSTH
jgi:hypothetical protein